MLAALRAQIGRLGRSGSRQTNDVLPLGAAAIDAVLPGGGVSRGGLHEVIAGDGSAAATGFAAALLTRLAGDRGVIVWCRRSGGAPGSPASQLYGGGLAGFGLEMRRLLVVQARRERELLWTMEEALRSGAVTGVLGELVTLPPIARRRLQLAAETGGATGLLLRPCGRAARKGEMGNGGMGISGKGSRWRVTATPCPSQSGPSHSGPSQSGPPSLHPSPADRERMRWRLDLVRCQGVMPASWLVEWCDATHRLAVVAPLADRPATPVAPTAGAYRATG